MTEVAKLLNEMNLNPRDDAARKLNEYVELYRGSMWAAVVFLSILAAILLWNVYAILRLQTQQKLGEMAMLRAMGISGRLLWQVYLFEAAVIWIRSVILGAVLGVGMGYAVSLWLSESSEEVWLGWSGSWYLWLIVLVLSLLACVGSVMVATWRVLRKSPITILGSV